MTRYLGSMAAILGLVIVLFDVDSTCPKAGRRIANVQPRQPGEHVDP